MEQNGLEVLVNCIELELANVSGEASQFVFTASNRSHRQPSQLSGQMPANSEMISQSGSQCVDSNYRMVRGIGRSPLARRRGSGSKTMIRFASITLEKSKTVVDRQSDVNGLEEGGTNERTRHEKRPKVVIKGKPTRLRKQMTPKPTSDPRISHVETLHELYGDVQRRPSDEENVRSVDADQGYKRSGVFDLQADTGSKHEAVAQHEQNNDCDSQIKNFDLGSAEKVAEWNKASSDCTTKTAPPNASGGSEGEAAPFATTTSGVRKSVNQVVEEVEPRRYFIRRRRVFGESLKSLARNHNNSKALQTSQVTNWTIPEITKNKRSKRDRLKRRSFEMWSGFSILSVDGVYNGRYICLPPFVPKRCKKTRTKVTASGHAPNVAPNASLSLFGRSSSPHRPRMHQAAIK